MATVQLTQVWRWECPHCGSVNVDDYEPCEAPELGDDMFADDDELAELAELIDGGEWAEVPETVTCGSCGGTFDAEVEGDDIVDGL